ncbi:MAG: sigma-70 family RNA polymerase sigma factor [Patulibacter minatonensis]
MTPERARFEAAYAAHGRAVLAYAMRRTDSHTAHDVLAEVFLVAWRRIDELPAEPLPWLLGTARRVLANARRADRRRDELAQRVVERAPTSLSSEAASVHAETESGPVLEALATLAEHEREALMLVAWDGLSASEAAEVVGVRPPAFRMRLSRARRQLARALDQRGAGHLVPEVARGR